MPISVSEQAGTSVTRRSPLRVLLLVLVVVAAAGAGFWAGQQFGREADNAEAGASEPVTATARTGTLGEEYPAPINLEWTQDLSLPFLGETAVVTALGTEPGDYVSIDSGAVIGTVLRPLLES